MNLKTHKLMNLKTQSNMEITKEDYMAIIGEMAYKSISQTDETNVRYCEKEAQEEISGYLRPTYDCDKIFNTTGNERNRQILMFMTDIALYHLSASLPQKMGSEVRKDRYERAIKWLEGVQQGKIVPNLPHASSTDEQGNVTQSGSLVFGSQKKLKHNW
jgi:phage gp36-like protein